MPHTRDSVRNHINGTSVYAHVAVAASLITRLLPGPHQAPPLLHMLLMCHQVAHRHHLQQPEHRLMGYMAVWLPAKCYCCWCT